MKLTEAQKNVLKMMYDEPTKYLSVGRMQINAGSRFGLKRLHSGTVNVLIKKELLVLDPKQSDVISDSYRLSNEGFIIASQL